MTCATAPYRLLVIGTILAAMLGMSWSVTLRGMQPTKKNTHFIGEKDKHFGDNVRVYNPHIVRPVGSLILLMGYGADLSWTMTQWWYLHPEWAPKDQEWCKGACVFGEEDKAAAMHLTSNLRIVDAVGTIRLAKWSHAWYKYTRWPDGLPITNEMEEAVDIVFRLIEHEYKIVGDYKRILLAGMSQGADLALEVGIRFPHQLGMVISERGVLHPSRRWRPGKQGNHSLAAPGTPFILTAGDTDELTPIATYKGDCASLQLMHTPVYFSMQYGLNHGDFSKPEWKLIIDAFSLMLSGDPKKLQLDYLTTWSSCVS